MAQHETEVELVRFDALGLDKIVEQTEQFGEEVDKARAKASAFADRINHPGYQRYLNTMVQIERQNAKLMKQHEQMKAQAEWEAKSTWEKSAGARAMGGRALGLGAAAGVGLAYKGLSGSSEMALLDARIQRLAQSIAGMAVPAVDRLTSLVEQLDRAARGMSGTQQAFVGSVGAGALAGGLIGGKKGAVVGGLTGGAWEAGTWIGDRLAGRSGRDRTDVTPYNPGMHDVGSFYADLFEKGQMMGQPQQDTQSFLEKISSGIDKLVEMAQFWKDPKPGT